MEEDYRRLLLQEAKRKKIARKNDFNMNIHPEKAPEEQAFRDLKKRAMA